MFHIGQLVMVKSLSPRNYLGMITKTVLYLDSFENAFYEVYLIDTRYHVTVPHSFIIPANGIISGSGSINYHDYFDF